MHGGALDIVRASFPDAPTPWVDLSTGINPWPWPVPPIPEASLHHLPRREAFDACREAMASAFGAPVDSVLPVPGSELIIRLLPSALGASSRQICLGRATYADHAIAWRAAGAAIREVDDPLSADPDEDVVICNPNNPTGQTWEPAALEAAWAAREGTDRWLIIDEAYADLTPTRSLAPSGGRDGLVILRSFGKFFGLAGVRLGALIAPGPVIKAVEQLLGQWAVAGPALWLGTRAYADRGWQEQTRQRLQQGQETLDHALHEAATAYQLTIEGGTALFRYVRVRDAHALWFALARSGVYVRRFRWSPHHLRIGLPSDTQGLERLREAVTPSA
ncbi:MAG: threonine-phosphate decarboxylase CobD [Pseudomonadota bacterium]